MHTIQPTTAWLTVNRRCNLRCKWCYGEGVGYSASNEMSLELAKKLATISLQSGVQNLLIIGGEPTLWHSLIEFNEFCAQKGATTILVTNGEQFGIDRFWRHYVQHPNTRIGLSLKAATPYQLRQVAGVANFETVKKGICRAIQKCNAQLSVTYNSFYAETLSEMAQFAVECGARSVKIDFCSATFINGQPKDTYMVNPRQLAKNIMRDYPQLERITNGHVTFEMMVPFCIWPPEFIEELISKKQLLSVCHVHKRKGVVFDEFGSTLMCNALFDYPIGRYGKEFYDGESLLLYLNTSKILSYYDRIGSYPSVACMECKWYSDCGGGCPLRWAVYKPCDIVQGR